MYCVIVGDMFCKCVIVCSGVVGFFNIFFDIEILKQRGIWDYGNYCIVRTYVVDFINTMFFYGVKEVLFGMYFDVVYVNCVLEMNEDLVREFKFFVGLYFMLEFTYSSIA